MVSVRSGEVDEAAIAGCRSACRSMEYSEVDVYTEFTEYYQSTGMMAHEADALF